MSQSTRILLALIVGLAVGIGSASFAPARALTAAGWVEPIGIIWLHALQMTIVPLVVSLLVTGVAASAEHASASKLAGRAFITFIVLLWISTAIGAALMLGYLELWPLGATDAAALRGALTSAAPVAEVPPFSAFLIAIVPSNAISAAANDAFLPLILFATVFAFAITRLPTNERAVLTGLFQALGNAMLVVINWVLWLGPIGVGAFAFVVGARAGTSAFGGLIHYILLICGVGIVLWALALPFAVLVARISPVRYLRAMGPSTAVALSTQSSLASLPAMLRAAETLNVPIARAGVVLPIAVAVFRWTSPAMNLAVALYVAHWFGIELTPGAIAAGYVTAAITTLGSVSLPGTVSFIGSIAPIAIAMGVPIAPLGLLIAVETIPDIFRTVGNVAMDVAATRAIAGEGGPESDADELVREGA
jgi:proton glutamate symport protein